MCFIGSTFPATPQDTNPQPGGTGPTRHNKHPIILSIKRDFQLFTATHVSRQLYSGQQGREQQGRRAVPSNRRISITAPEKNNRAAPARPQTAHHRPAVRCREAGRHRAPPARRQLRRDLAPARRGRARVPRGSLRAVGQVSRGARREDHVRVLLRGQLELVPQPVHLHVGLQGAQGVPGELYQV